MSTRTSRVAVSLAAFAMAAGLAGCMASPDKAVQSTDSAAITASPASQIPQSQIPQSPASQAPSDQLAALTAYVSGAQPLIPQLLDQNPGLYSEIQINGIDADTVEFAYFYAEQTDTSGAADYFDGMLSTFQSVVDSAVIPEMTQSGITVDPKVRYTYYNADGTLIWSHTFAGS